MTTSTDRANDGLSFSSPTSTRISKSADWLGDPESDIRTEISRVGVCSRSRETDVLRTPVVESSAKNSEFFPDKRVKVNGPPFGSGSGSVGSNCLTMLPGGLFSLTYALTSGNAGGESLTSSTVMWTWVSPMAGGAPLSTGENLAIINHFEYFCNIEI